MPSVAEDNRGASKMIALESVLNDAAKRVGNNDAIGLRDMVALALHPRPSTIGAALIGKPATAKPIAKSLFDISESGAFKQPYAQMVRAAMLAAMNQ